MGASDKRGTITAEIGVINYHANHMITGRCYLVMNYEGETYVGALNFDNQSLCMHVCKILNYHVEKPIREIGD